MMEVLNGKVSLHSGDCLDVLASLKPNSIDACVTDPPYHLTSCAVGWETYSNGRGGTKAGNITKKGFMGKTWDGGDIAFRPETWAAVFRVLKPGGHILAFGATRTYHRMACAIEDAGFEIRDCCMWITGQGFPKSRNVSKDIDRAAGAEREVIGSQHITGRGGDTFGYGKGKTGLRAGDIDITVASTAAARQWEGWGTALKPACEPIVLARKPLSEKTVATNVLRWGTGALNIDACRVEGVKPQVTQGINGNATSFNVAKERRTSGDPNEGRWPANLLHDGSEEVVGAFPETTSGALSPGHGSGNSFGVGNDDKKPRAINSNYGGDSGSAARFFKNCGQDDNFGGASRIHYCAKASKKDRAGSKHPTVKPIKLIRYLIRLVTPPKGIVLDPFAGSGTTGAAAVLEGARAVLIEREREYIRDIRRRIRKRGMTAMPHDRIAA